VQKLYYVEVEKKNYAIVAARNASEAEQQADIDSDEILDDVPDVICWATEIKDFLKIPVDWVDEVPYNSDEKLTCREMMEILDAHKNWELRDKMQLKFDFWDKLVK
jgi:hypothetical protein